ncbi:MAG TPA: hypothetical protein VNQ81_00020 [Povalibacter sp.]|nr:hypothetical protein [Povalibacter sp.]
MWKAVAMTLLVVGAMNAGAAGSSEGQSEAGEQAATPGSAEFAQKQASERAKQALAEHLNIAASEITVAQIEPRTWSNSSMGCGKPGSMALDVITEGYAVSLAAQGKTYRVHVSAANAVVCREPTLRRNASRQASNARGLDVMIEKARQDLAQRIGVEPTAVRLLGTRPQRWADSGLDCPREGEAVVPGPVNGYRISLKSQSRIFTYHSDLEDVRACPPIEAQ